MRCRKTTPRRTRPRSWRTESAAQARFAALHSFTRRLTAPGDCAATFHALLPLQNFPLDAHTLCIELLSKWDSAHVRLVRNLKSAYRSVVAVERFTRRNEFALSPRVHLLSRTSDPRHSGRGRVYSRLDVQLRVRRKLSFWLWNLWLPLFQFTLMSFASMLVEITWFDARLSITLTMLLTKVSYRFSMDEVLPRISYLTLVDKYYLLCIAVSSVLTVQAIVVCWEADADPSSVVMRLNNLQLPSEQQASQRFYMLTCGGAWIAFNILLPAAAVMWRASQKAAEASLWWSEPRDSVLWVGPVNPGAAAIARGALQTAFDDAYNARCKALGLSRSTTRSTIASFATVSLHSLRLGSTSEQEELDAENAEDESVHAKRPPRRVQVVDVEVMTPESLAALRTRGTFRYALPATRSAFVLIEFASAGQATEALELLQDACNSEATHAALAQASTVHIGAANGDEGAAAAAPNASPSKPSPSPRTRRMPGFGGVRTLQDVARAWHPTGPRQVVVEQALPEFVHLLAASAAARSAAEAAAATVRAFTREWMAPRRSSETTAGLDAHISSRLTAQSSGRRPSSGGNGASPSAYDAKDGSTGDPQRASLDILGATVRRSFTALGNEEAGEANGGDTEMEGVSPPPKPLVSALRKK